MKNSAFKNFSFRKTIIILLCMLFGLTASSLFVFLKTDKNLEFENVVSAEQTELPPVEERQYELILNKGNNNQDEISSKVIGTNNGTGYEWKIVSGNASNVFEGGSTIRIFATNPKIIYILDSSGTDVAIIELVLDEGYELISYNFGNDDMSDYEYLDVETMTQDAEFSFEALDPDYTGTIQITPYIRKNMYDLIMYYEAEDDGNIIYSPHTVKSAYSIVDVCDLTKWSTIAKLKPSADPADKVFDGWLLNYTYALSGGAEEVTNAGSISLSTGSVNVTIMVDTGSSFVGAGGHTFYLLKSITGTGRVSDCYSATDPWIVAKYKNAYTFNVDNTSTYWTNQLFELSEEDRLKLRGVGSTAEDQAYSFSFKLAVNDDKTKKIPSSSDGSNYFSFYKKDEMFTPFSDTDWQFYVYNYGFYVSGWKITVQIGTTTYIYVCDESNNVSLVKQTEDNNKFYSGLIGQEFTQITEKLTSLMVGEFGLPTITMYPEWTPVTIMAFRNGNPTDIAFGQSYELTDDDSVYAYTYDTEPNIAMSGVWNYKTIPSEKFTCSYSNGVEAELTLDACSLDSVYKVNLDNVRGEGNRTYKLITEDNGFNYSDSADENPVARYDYNDILTLEAHDSTSYPLIDDYISTVLSPYKGNYEEKIDGDGTGDADILKKVYYSTGTLTDGVLTATNPSMWVYLANNQETGLLPTFETRYLETILWSFDGCEIATDIYEDSFAIECVGGLRTSWDIKFGKTATAIYVNKIDLYYLNNAGNYQYVTAKYFNKNIPTLNIENFKPNESDFSTESNKKTFYKWMFDIELATEYYPYTIEGSIEAGKKITVKNGSLATEFTVSALHTNGKYCYISEVKGDPFIQEDNKPIITMKTTHDYEFEINNQINYWKDFDLTAEEKLSLAGVAKGDSATTEYNNTDVISLSVGNLSGGNYPFMTSFVNNTGLSFFNADDMTKDYAVKTANGSWYYAYNYGHYIKGWKISFEFIEHESANGVVLWITNNFVASNGTSSDYYHISTNTSKHNFTMVAAAIDLYCADAEINEIPRVVLEPVWEKANIEIEVETGYAKDTSNRVLATTTYSSPYELNNSKTKASLGQTLYVYSTTINNYWIATNEMSAGDDGIWNYRKILKDEFTYDVTDYLGSGTYKIQVRPIYVDNIYKIALNDVRKNVDGKYKLETQDFAFNDEVNEEAREVLRYYHFSDYKLYEQEQYPLIDGYIDFLSIHRAIYANKINGDGSGDDEIFKKIYYSNGTANADKDELTVENTASMWIYLAHNQKTGKLPAFKTRYYTTIFWEFANPAVTTNVVGTGMYGTEFAAELTARSKELSETFNINSEPTMATNATAIYVNKIDLYYLDTAGNYQYITAKHFSRNLNKLSIDDTIPPTGEKTEFYDWMFNIELATSQTYKYTVQIDGALAVGKQIVVTNGLNETKFTISALHTNDNYCYISDVEGDAFVQQDANPIIIRKKIQTYNFEVNNTESYSNNYWKGYDVTKEDLQLSGVWWVDELGGSKKAFKTNQFKVANEQSYAYPFMTSKVEDAILSFYQGDEIGQFISELMQEDAGLKYCTTEGKWYYAYSYGHYIKGWKISFEFAQTTNKNGVILWINNEFVASNGTSTDYYHISDNTVNHNFTMLAEAIDLYLISNQINEVPKVVIAPVWESVTINVKTPKSHEITFGGEYTLTGGNVTAGKEIYAYTYETDANIATKGVWNYRNISSETIVSTEVGKAEISLKSCLLDNVYKVELKDLRTNEANNYELENANFAFNSTPNGKTNNVYKYNDILDFEIHDATKYPLIDEYISAFLSSYKNNYEEEIDGDGSGDDEIFKKVYYSTGTLNGKELQGASAPTMWIYLANNQTTGKLPMFKTRYYTTILWKFTGYDIATAEYKDEFAVELVGNLSEIWVIGYGQEATATYINKIDLYYLNLSGTYSWINVKYFSQKQTLRIDNLLPEDSEYKTANKEFYNWVFDVELARSNTYGYEVTGDFEVGKQLVVTNGSNVTKFTICALHTNSNYYYISEVRGDAFYQLDNAPIITMRTLHNYNFKVNNNGDYTENYWKGFDSTKEDIKLSGASIGDSSTESYSNTFTTDLFLVANKAGYNYPFMTSHMNGTGLSFFHDEDMTKDNAATTSDDKWYYVYNYGHYIKGWEINFEFSTANEAYNGIVLWVTNEFVASNGTSTDYYHITTNTANHDFRMLAGAIDFYLDSNMITEIPTVIVSPVWEKANINVVGIDVNSGNREKTLTANAKFEEAYFLANNQMTIPAGKSLYAYSYEAGKLIATNEVSEGEDGLWNYKEISNNNFIYDETELGIGKYTIKVTPLFVDNVYKVELKDLRTNEANNYELENANFAFNSTPNGKTNNVYKYNDILDFEIHDATKYPLIDEYISAFLSSYKNNYEEEIDGDGSGDDEIFKKVYYSTGTLNGKELQGASAPTMWIYLANNQTTGKLPMFKTRYYTTILWKFTGYDIATAEYKDEFAVELVGNLSEIWVIGYGQEATATYINKIDLYYLNLSGTYSWINVKYFSQKQTLRIDNLLPEDSEYKTANKEFYNWVFDVELARSNTYGYEVTGDFEVGKQLVVTNGSNVTKFTICALHTNSNYYYISEVRGDAFYQLDNAPIITMRTLHNYNFKVNNNGDYTENYWKGFDSTKEDIKLSGASIGDSSTESYSNTFTTDLFLVANKAGYNYPFMTSHMNGTGLSFFHDEDMTKDNAATTSDDKWYYVYNYGHYIKGWEINFEFSTANEAYNGIVLWVTNEFVASNGTSTDYYHITTNTANHDFRMLAGAIDFYLDSNMITEIPTVIVSPVWEKANINVVGIDVNSGNREKTLTANAKFEEAYFLANNQMTIPAGKSLYAYSYEAGKLIATNEVSEGEDGLWNYKEISNNNFIYDETELGIGKYTIKVTPVFVDNIYKVELTEAVKKDSETYQLANMSFDKSTASLVDMLNFDDFSIIDKNGYTFRYYQSTDVLIDDYIEILNQYYTDYLEGINCNGTEDFTIFDYVYSNVGTVNQEDDKILETSSNATLFIYLANDQLFKVRPEFVHDLSLLIHWQNVHGAYAYSTLNYSEPLYGEELKFEDDAKRQYELQDKWLISHGGAEGDLALKARYVYSFRLYYSTDATTAINPIHDSINLNTLGYFGRYTEVDLYDDAEIKFKIEPASNPTNKTFERWFVDIDQARTQYGFNCVLDEANKTLTVSKTGILIEFKYSHINAYNSNLIYITKVNNGYGRMEQINTKPIVRAKWSNLFDLTIDNSNTYWKDLDKDNATLYGAYSTCATDADVEPAEFYKTSLRIANDVAKFDYPFMTSESSDGSYGTSFYHLEDWQTPESAKNLYAKAYDGTYYVFNYGYYISGYQLIIEAGIQKHFFTKIENGWGASAIPTTIDLEYLIGVYITNLSEYAEQADEFAAQLYDSATLTLIPVWEKANIQVEVDNVYAFNDADVVLTKTKFATNYNLNNAKTYLPTGKSIITYHYATDKLIATNTPEQTSGYAGIWNYRDIPSNIYHTYSKTTDVGEGTYIITILPDYVDNIYKVNLNNVKIYRENLYRITNSEFIFNSTAGTYAGTSQIELSFDEKVDSTYSFKRFNNEALMDNYILDLATYKSDYISGITYESANHFDIFKKVYYSNGTVSSQDSSFDTLTSSTNPTFHIYLANNQHTGDLPVFKKDYYTLIFWKNIDHIDPTSCNGMNCTNYKNHYAYSTNEYLPDVHKQEIVKYSTHVDKDGNFNYIWQFTDGYNRTNNTVTFEAFYFRKNYELNVFTINKENQTLERRGYVRVSAIDKVYEIDKTVEDVSFDYVIIFDGTQMSIYQYVNGALIDNYYFNNNITEAKILIYEGCDVNMFIYDQSKDAKSMASGQFDDMIGYKYADNIIQKVTNQTGTTEKDLFDDHVENNKYKYFNDASSIKDKNYKNKDIIEIYVEFDRIIYNLNLNVDNTIAGAFAVETNGSLSQYNTSYHLTNMAVQNMYKLDYFAYAGFKLEENAFVYLNGQSTLTLQQYLEDEGQIDEQYVLTQNYYQDGTLDGRWLRRYFYVDYTDYALSRTDLGTIQIMTCPIEFILGVKVYDDSDVNFVQAGSIIETTTEYDQALSLNEATGKGLTPEVYNYLTNEDYNFYYYSSTEEIDYALLSTRMYFPKNHTTEIDNFYLTYSFLLNVKPVNQFELTSMQLAQMVNNFEEGKIISVNDRNIYIMLEVRKLLTVTMRVAELSHDSNSTIRTTTLTNADNNSQSIVIEPGAESESILTYTTSPVLGYFYSVTGETDVIAYTYYGLENNLTSSYDTARYSKVDYVLDGAPALTENSFVVTEDASLLIKYIPQSMNVEFVYTLNGEIKTYEEITQYIIDENEYKPKEHYVYRVGDYLTYYVECVNPEYNVSVRINQTFKGSTDLTNRKVKCIVYEVEDEDVDNRYLVTNIDYELGKIQIFVDVTEMVKGTINVKFQLKNSSKSYHDDVYGTFSLYEEDTLKAEDVDRVSNIYIVKGRDVFVKLALNAGYAYDNILIKGIKQNVVPDANGFIKLVGDFNPETHDGDYTIVIDKISLTAILNTSNVNENSQYSIKNFSKPDGWKMSLTGLYVGTTVAFKSEPAQEERLNYFYYLDKNSNKVQIADDGMSEFITIRITSDMLKQVNKTIIDFGVEVIDRYKLDVIVVGEEYLKQDGLKLENSADGQAYVPGTYVDDGTEIVLSAETILTGKYDITVDETPNTIQTEKFDIINKGDVKFTLTEDYVCKITISPKQYSVNVQENLYTTLSAVRDNTPDTSVTEENYVNAIQASGQKYNEQATLQFVRKTEDRELSTLFISKNDNEDNLVIEFVNNVYSAYKITEQGEKENVNLLSYGFNIMVSENFVKLTYVTYNDIDVRFDYKLYKVIQA